MKNKEMQPFDLRPHDYGEFPTSFETRTLGGGSFDLASGRLYVTVQRADTLQGTYFNPPVVVVYGFKTDLKRVATAFGETDCSDSKMVDESLKFFALS